LIGECDKNFIDRLYDKQLKKYIKSAKYMISKKRLLMAYEYFYNKNNDQALKHYEDLKKLSNSYPNRGEADMELMLGNWIKERIIN
jgi:GTP-sensing pleiotropic transcriptional regulator CodY